MRLCVLLLELAPLASVAGIPPTLPDPIPRDPLETRALVAPQDVLAEIPGALATARATGDLRRQSLLQLARANACRVLADWTCQRDAGIAARRAAEGAGLPQLQVRGLIAESRGRIQLQDFSRSEHLLGDAERRLLRAPMPELKAEIMLAYSSLSYTVGKHAAAADYAARGLSELHGHPALPVRIRLLRNRANALGQLGRSKEAQTLVDQALLLAQRIDDPKLAAELRLEVARLARLRGDRASQETNGRSILELAGRLRNSQLQGMGHEVMGLAAQDAGDIALAERQFRLSRDAFASMGSERDERRVLRALVGSLLGRGLPAQPLEALTGRLVTLETSLDERDQILAGDDLGARLKYAEQEFAVQRLQSTAALVEQRQATLAGQRRLAWVSAALSFGLLLLAAASLAAQRRLNGRLTTVVARLRDSERLLSANEARTRAITDNVPALIAGFDRQLDYAFANAATGRLLGRAMSDIVGHGLLELHGPEVYARLLPHAEAALRGETVSFEGLADIRGRRFNYRSSYVPDVDAGGEVQGFLALTVDITELKQAEAQLNALARMDSLTGVANRRHFEERLDEALVRCRRQRSSVALLCLDIDRFKAINDGHGHPVGDAVIVGFAQRLQACVRETDLVARLGGDEFVVLLENASGDSAGAVAEKILASLREPMPAGTVTLLVSASIGVTCSTGAATAGQLLAAADQALYAAKSAGRNAWRSRDCEPAG